MSIESGRGSNLRTFGITYLSSCTTFRFLIGRSVSARKSLETLMMPGLLTCQLEEVVDGVNGWLFEVREVAEDRAESILDEVERAAEIEEVEELFRDYLLPEGEAMLSVIHTMDPPGVGARDLRECILLQFNRLQEGDSLAYRLVSDHFEDFLHHKWNEIARTLGISPREIQDAADEVAKLDPKPGLRHAPDDDT